MNIPVFPELRSLSPDSRPFIHSAICEFQPVTSELTFTNLFMWRHYYQFKWSVLDKTIVIFAHNNSIYPFQPIGPRPLKNVMLNILYWLQNEHNIRQPHFERVDMETAKEFSGDSRVKIEPLRDHFDYRYNTSDLIHLSGRHYHSKRNHITRFNNEYNYIYKPLTADLVDQCISFSKHWCKIHHFDNDDTGLRNEWEATIEALTHFDVLQFKGGAITINNAVEAFTIGELLNRSTAVIHIEKANSEIHGLYSAINQLFCQNEWKSTHYINREQDLGNSSLRAAKASYHPEKLVEKFTIRLI